MDQHSEGEPQRPQIPDRTCTLDVFNKRGEVFSQEENAEAWTKAAGMVQTYSDELIKRWKEEIDTYLVFAGLFSAVLTTFNVQSYILLQPATPDPSIALLQQISAQLGSFSVNPPFINSTVTPNAESSTTPHTSPRWAVWLNGLWFSGLILSLSSASIGIMVKQWLNEYKSGVSGTSRHVARLRQYRLHNLRKWRVEDIVGAIPVLLQIALACFLAGILVLLWNLHNTVAAIASTLAGVLAIFTATTSLLPLFDHSCTYLTPQIRAIHSIWSPGRTIHWLLATAASWSLDIPSLLIGLPYRFISFLLRLRASRLVASRLAACGLGAPRLGSRLGRLLKHLHREIISLASLVASPPEAWKGRKQTWQGREQSIISDLTHELETQILVEAYASTLHPDALSAASVCLMDFPHGWVMIYFKRLHRAAQEHFGAAADSKDDALGPGNQQRLLWLYVLVCMKMSHTVDLLYLPPSDPRDLSGEQMDTLGVYFRSGRWPSSMKASEAEWAMSAMFVLMDDIIGTSSLALALIRDSELPEARLDLLDNALRRKECFSSVVLAGVSGAYLRVRLGESRFVASMLDWKATFTVHLSNIFYFLEIVDRALRKESLPSEDLETMRAYARDVLMQLTRASPKMSQLRDQMYHSDPATVDARQSGDVTSTRFWRLSDEVLRCIPDSLVLDFFHMVHALARLEVYGSGKGLPLYAYAFMHRVIRIKGRPAGVTSPQASSTGPLRAETSMSIIAEILSQQPSHGQPSATAASTTPAGEGL